VVATVRYQQYMPKATQGQSAHTSGICLRSCTGLPFSWSPLGSDVSFGNLPNWDNITGYLNLTVNPSINLCDCTPVCTSGLDHYLRYGYAHGYNLALQNGAVGTWNDPAFVAAYNFYMSIRGAPITGTTAGWNFYSGNNGDIARHGFNGITLQLYVLLPKTVATFNS
jgi:hypothetical protein